MTKYLPFLLCLFLFACGGSQTQTQQSTASNSDSLPPEEDPGPTMNIVFFGNSLTAGYQLENESDAYPARIQSRLDSLGYNCRVVNAGLSGETSAGGNSRIDWILKQPISIFVLELGGNDGLRGLDLKETKKNLQSILDKVKKAYPDATLVIAGMEVPPNMGKAYAKEFHDIYPSLAESNDATLIPFLLDGVGGIPELNLPDGIHPTAEGYKIVAENVWKILEPILLQKVSALHQPERKTHVCTGQKDLCPMKDKDGSQILIL